MFGFRSSGRTIYDLTCKEKAPSIVFWAELFKSRVKLTRDEKLIEELIFLVSKRFSLFMFCAVCDYSNPDLKNKQYQQKPHRKVTKLKSKFSLTLGQLNRALNNPALIVKRETRKVEASNDLLLNYVQEETVN